MIGTLLLDRYELLEKIGEGGMATVYKAKCHLLNRFVAVKILKPEFNTDEEFVTRFKKEGTSIARLSHLNIVNIYDVGSEGHINFLVMEYINGKTLKQLIKENGRLSSEMTLNIALQITEALECAHKNNIIHRDIKPDNIMITEDNITKVMDFGIAKVADSRTVTNLNKVMGSVHYFSPEQAKGNFIDCRTDIYSLGIVMYEMVTGSVPYDADSAITIAMMHIQEPVTAPKEIIADIPENINQVILTAMQKEPIKRYQTAKEMASILSAIKKNFKYNIDANKGVDDNTMIIDAVKSSDMKNDFTTVMSKSEVAKQITNKKNRELPHRNKMPSKNKKTMIIIASIILVMIAGVSGKSFYKGTTSNTPTSIVKPIVPTTSEKSPVTSDAGSTGTSTTTRSVRESAGTSAAKDSVGGSTETSAAKASVVGSNKPSSTKDSVGSTGTSAAKASVGKSTGTSGTKASVGGSTGTSSTTGSVGGSTGTSGTAGSVGGSTGTSGTTGSVGGSTGTSGTTGSVGGSTGTSGTTGSAGGSTGTSDATGSAGESTGTSGIKGK